MGFTRQGYWGELPFSSPGDPPNPGIEPMSPALQVDSLPLSHLGNPLIAIVCNCYTQQFLMNLRTQVSVPWIPTWETWLSTVSSVGHRRAHGLSQQPDLPLHTCSQASPLWELQFLSGVGRAAISCRVCWFRTVEVKILGDSWQPGIPSMLAGSWVRAVSGVLGAMSLSK